MLTVQYRLYMASEVGFYNVTNQKNTVYIRTYNDISVTAHMDSEVYSESN